MGPPRDPSRATPERQEHGLGFGIAQAFRGVRSAGRRGSVRDPRGESSESEFTWFFLSLGLATVIALIDGYTGGSAVLTTALVLPPVLAAATTGERMTALTAAYCILMAVLTGIWDDIFLTGDWALRFLVVTLGGSLSVWGASQRDRLTAGIRGGSLSSESLEVLENVFEEEAIAERVARAAVPELADLCFVDLVEPDGSIRTVAVAARDEELHVAARNIRERYPIDPASSHPVAEAARSGSPRNLRNMGDSDVARIAQSSEHRGVIARFRPKSMLIVPLSLGNGVLGTLMLVSLDDGDRYGAGEAAFAGELARWATLGVHSARLHAERAELSQALHQSLIPRGLPSIEGLEIAARFRPMGVGSEVGGDFYDLFQLGDRSWAAVIGDVCGKGAEAAALTSLMRDTLRASALRGESPCGTLNLLNAAILEAGTDGRFCTSAYARLDLNGDPTRLTVCNGGHPTPLVLRRDGAVEEVGPSGTLLGVYDDLDLVDTPVQLRRDEALVLITDGVIEVRPRDRVTHTEALAESLPSYVGGSAEEIAAAIESHALEAHEGHPRDDIAILVLKRV